MHWTGRRETAKICVFYNGSNCNGGRNRNGAVMGSKNLKAIPVRNSGSVRVAEPAAMLKLSLDVNSKIREHPGCKKLSDGGVFLFVAIMYQFGFFPAVYVDVAHWEKVINSFGGLDYVERFQLKNLGCFGCTVRCKNFSVFLKFGEALRVAGGETLKQEYR